MKFQKRGLKNLGWQSNYVQAVTAIKPLSVCITIHTGNTLLWSRKCPNIVWSAGYRKKKKMKWLYHLLVQRQHSMSIITFLLWIKLSHLKKTQIVNFRLIPLFFIKLYPCKVTENIFNWKNQNYLSMHEGTQFFIFQILCLWMTNVNDVDNFRKFLQTM